MIQNWNSIKRNRNDRKNSANKSEHEFEIPGRYEEGLSGNEKSQLER